tara:strand:- start:1280 stop:1861 length:582 start_codon:yes stop_codon:yes gene_type:complete
MKKIKNFIFISLGIIFILSSIILLFDGSTEYVMIVSGICFGILFIYPSFQKEQKTDSEKFIEKEDIDVPIWWKRFLGFLIDYTIIVIIYVLFVVTVEKLFDVNLDGLNNPIFLMFPLMIFYYVIQEFLFNTTIGKSVFKLMVISVNTGEKLTLSDVIIRTLSRFIPLDLLFFFSKRPVGLHDIISKTVVVTKI